MSPHDKSQVGEAGGEGELGKFLRFLGPIEALLLENHLGHASR